MSADDLCLARLSCAVARKNYEGMDDALAAAKNRRGVVMKYLHMISPKAFAAEPYSSLSVSSEANSYWTAGIAISELMLEKLRAFAGLHGIEVPASPGKI